MSSDAVSQPTEQKSDSARNAAVERARTTWINRLIDLSQRNNLLYYRPLKVGSLDLTLAENEPLIELLGGKSVPLKKLLARGDLTQTLAQAKQIHRRRGR